MFRQLPKVLKGRCAVCGDQVSFFPRDNSIFEEIEHQITHENFSTKAHHHLHYGAVSCFSCRAFFRQENNAWSKLGTKEMDLKRNRRIVTIAIDPLQACRGSQADMLNRERRL